MNLNKTNFTENLIRVNKLRFNRWIFEPGMLFSSESKWWGDKGPRDKQHNGLDLLFYVTDNGIRRTINEDTKIPIIYKGTIVKNIKDFLGVTMIAAHELYEDDSQLFTLYGHVLPVPDVIVGGSIEEGEVISTLAAPNNTNVPSHLHLSAVLIPRTIPLETLSWKTLEENENIIFIDPKNLI